VIPHVTYQELHGAGCCCYCGRLSVKCLLMCQCYHLYKGWLVPAVEGPHPFLKVVATGTFVLVQEWHQDVSFFTL
jgi:hypothetical protein